MPAGDCEKWNARYREGQHAGPEPARVLVTFKHLLPEKGTALDLACGTGANAIVLASAGLTTSAWDISSVALQTLADRATRAGLAINTEERDVVRKPPAADTYDVISVSYFLDRGLFTPLIDSLKPGGLLFYQTFLQDKVSDTGPHNPDYRLARNELLALCRSLRILYYHEEGTVGDTGRGFRNEAMLIGRKEVSDDPD